MKAKEFGEYLKSVRKSKKMTIRQLELYSGVSNAYISQLERGIRGIPSPDIIQKLGKALDIEYEELMVTAGYIKKPDPELSEEDKRSLLEFIDSSPEFLKTIDLSDNELFDKYSFIYEGEELDDDVVKLIRSYIRFILKEKKQG